MEQLTIIRGLPGSGKSTLAKTYNAFHVEADMYHVIGDEYRYDTKRQKDAHNWCFAMFAMAVEAGIDVVVSNTFTRLWEFSEYIEKAKQYHYKISVIRLENDFGSIHNVPEYVVRQMETRFEDYEGEDIH